MPPTLEKPLGEISLLDCDLSMSDQDYWRLVGEADRGGPPAPEVRRNRTLDKTATLAFPSDTAALAKQRADIARRQAEADEKEEALRSKADQFRAAVARRDELRGRIAFAQERLGRLPWHTKEQQALIETILCDKQRPDSHCFNALACLDGLERASQHITEFVARQQTLLVAAERAVSEFEKAK